MPVAEVGSSSQTAHYKRQLQESLIWRSAAYWYLPALIETLFSHFRHTAVFTIAHRIHSSLLNVILHDW